MPRPRMMWHVAHYFRMISYSLLYRSKEQSEKDRKLSRFLGNKTVIIATIAI